jgi:NAD(P)-dependent dehydrogenase (short-subunit alcohol dehydrogenase family)
MLPRDCFNCWGEICKLSVIILLTGCAGFIGARVGEILLARGDCVVGVDNLNDYYDAALKRHRLDGLARPALQATLIWMRGLSSFARCFRGKPYTL